MAMFLDVNWTAKRRARCGVEVNFIRLRPLSLSVFRYVMAEGKTHHGAIVYNKIGDTCLNDC